MEFEEYKIMYKAEDTHWWYRSLRGVMVTLLGLDRQRGRGLKILDAGCGTGGNMQALLGMGFRDVSGFDLSPTALHFCEKRGLDWVKHGSITDVPYPSDAFDVVISCDVLNDTGTQDEDAALRELYRVLKPGGRLFLNLPAFSFLRGEHDIATDVARRYTRREISEKLRRAGFKPRRLSYWNMVFFPVVVLVRLMRSDRASASNRPARSDIMVPPAQINALLTLLLKSESALIRRIDLPVGSSLAVLAVKPKAVNT